MEYLLGFFIVIVCFISIINFIKTRRRNIENDYKEHCNVPPTAMTVKYIRGIPEVDAEIEKRYSHIINNAYTKFDGNRYKNFVEDLEKNEPLYFEDTVRKIKNKINDPRFAKNLCSVDSDILIYMFEKVGIIDFYFWVNEDKFYLVDKHPQGIGTFEFNLDKVTCYCRKEDIEQERDASKEINIDGFSEFRIGTVLGDGTITFNKSIFPQNIKIDEKVTVVEFIFGEKIHCGFFGAESYEVFKNQIIEKELKYILNHIQTKPLGSVIVGMKELKIESEEIMDKINKLIDLKEYGLFTEVEFEEKKKILLDKIKH
ncbi:hypothetical protein [Clostridium sp.]|uniref:hypothetical protein n=1 Tax=Clostridium sp. TaxID=1506 RepID=UPI002FC998FA